MSSPQREREKWRIKRQRARQDLRVFSTVAPVQKPEGLRVRHTQSTWNTIPMEVFRLNNRAISTGVA
ncbi:hypothetical protein ACFWNE_06635 [Streptomyces goshikiensis]|uniref:hypothetical protein n=1 Tax=Streptomyces TaxID=1883 RepID=UPI000F42ECD0|nr:hypothetical protein [Streptomyces sp. ADI95-16]AYV29650.1 hypothetical protein EES41_23320 [Streptomyces sp. ADI95-16]